MRVCYIDCSPFMRTLLTLEIEARIPGLVVYGEPASMDDLLHRLRDTTVVLNGHTPMPAALLRQCPKLRSIVFLGSGAGSYIDLEAAAELGIVVRTVPGYGDRAVAEHAMAMLLAASRQLAAMDRAIRNGIWDPLEGMEIEGKRVGVIGTGGIGRCFIRLAAAFGMEVVTWNRSAAVESLPAQPMALDMLLDTSDIVSLHLALNDDTRGFLGASRLARLKPSAILVNTARGALLDEPALIEALKAGRLRHAALDVYAEEPLPPGHPLAQLPNVTLSAHAGFKTPEASCRLLALAVDLAARDLADFETRQS